MGQVISSGSDSLRTIDVSGKVMSETTGESLPGAHIFINNNKIPAAVSDTAGIFILKQIPAGKWTILTITYVGFEHLTRRCFFPSGSKQPLGFKLKEHILEEVLVQAPPPLVVQKGDTTEFNATAAKLTEDADLQDLLKKLPGFEIIDGKLMANGEVIQKIYLDGTEYALSNPMSLLKDLPASLVSKIKTFDDRSDVAKFSGYDDGNKFRSMNIVTKNPNKMKYFGTEQLSCALPEVPQKITENLNYGIQLGLNAFNPKYRFSISFDDERSNSSNELPDAIYRGKREDNRRTGWETDFSLQTPKAGNYTGSYNGGDNISYSARKSQKDYFPTDRFESRVLNTESHSWNRQSNHNASTKIELNLSTNKRLTLRPTLNISNSNRKSLNYRNSIENGDTINQTFTSDESIGEQQRWGNELAYMQSFRKKGRALTVNLQYENSKNNSTEKQHNQSREKVEEGVLQYRKGRTEQESEFWKASLSYSEPLTENVRLAFNYNFDHRINTNDCQNYTYTDDTYSNVIQPDTALTSFLKTRDLEHRLGMNYNYNKNRNSLKVGLSLNIRDMNNFYAYLNRRDSSVSNQYIDFSPRIEGSRRLNKRTNLQFNYSGTSSSPSSDQLTNVLNVADPLAVSKGNPNLKKRYNQSLDFSYNTSSGEKGGFYSIRLSAGNTMNKITTSRTYLTKDTVIDGYPIRKGASFSTPINLNGDWQCGVNASCSFGITSLKLRLNPSLSYNYTRTPSINDGILNYNNSQNLNLRLSFMSNVSENIDFNIVSSSIYTNSRNTSTGGSIGFKQNLNVSAKWIIFKRLVWGANYALTYSWINKNDMNYQPNNILDLDAGVKLFKKRQGELKFIMTDLFRQKNIITNSVNDLYTEKQNNLSVYMPYKLTFSYRFIRTK